MAAQPNEIAPPSSSPPPLPADSGGGGVSAGVAEAGVGPPTPARSRPTEPVQPPRPSLAEFRWAECLECHRRPVDEEGALDLVLLNCSCTFCRECSPHEPETNIPPSATCPRCGQGGLHALPLKNEVLEQWGISDLFGSARVASQAIDAAEKTLSVRKATTHAGLLDQLDKAETSREYHATRADAAEAERDRLRRKVEALQGLNDFLASRNKHLEQQLLELRPEQRFVARPPLQQQQQQPPHRAGPVPVKRGAIAADLHLPQIINTRMTGSLPAQAGPFPVATHTQQPRQSRPGPGTTSHPHDSSSSAQRPAQSARRRGQDHGGSSGPIQSMGIRPQARRQPEASPNGNGTKQLNAGAKDQLGYARINFQGFNSLKSARLVKDREEQRRLEGGPDTLDLVREIASRPPSTQQHPHEQLPSRPPSVQTASRPVSFKQAQAQLQRHAYQPHPPTNSINADQPGPTPPQQQLQPVYGQYYQVSPPSRPMSAQADMMSYCGATQAVYVPQAHSTNGYAPQTRYTPQAVTTRPATSAGFRPSAGMGRRAWAADLRR